MKNSILKVLIFSLCASALVGILFILTGGFGSGFVIQLQILSTTSTVFGFSIAGLCCSTLYEKEKYRTFSKIGMITCLFGCLLLIGIIWNFISVFSSGFVWQLLFTSIVLSFSFAHLSLLLLINSQDNMVEKIKKITIILAIILNAMILNIIWSIFPFYSEFYGRLIAVLSILVVLGTIVSPILNKINKNGNAPTPNQEVQKQNQEGSE